VRPSTTPNSWQIGRITVAGALLGSCFLLFCTAILAVGKYKLHLDLESLRTLCVVAIIFGSQASTYAIRDRQYFFGLRPTPWLVISSVADIIIICVLALGGIAMAPLPLSVVACEFAAAIALWLLLAGVKIPVFARLKMS
jgi:H+-transporting ATPase